MQVVFNLLDVGLANNGGSKTLVRMAQELSKLGHGVSISATKYSDYKLTPIDVPILRGLPDTCDVIIATGYRSVKSTLAYTEARKKFYYIRGFETWNTPVKQLNLSYTSGLKCIANSRWIQEHITSLGVPCQLIYQGLDFDNYRNFDAERSYDLGGVWHGRSAKRTKDLHSVIAQGEFTWRLLGSSFKSSNITELVDYYNSIRVWMSPSESEGLQNCPMEAALCGCPLVITDHPRAGGDYIIDNETCLVYRARDIVHGTEQVKRLLLDSNLRKRLNRNMIEWLRENVKTKAEAALIFEQELVK